MLLHFNPATPHFFAFLCPQTLALAVVDKPSAILYPVTGDHLGTITAAHTASITTTMADYSEEPFNPRIVSSTPRIKHIAVPEWLIFTTLESDKLLILHTTAPVFLSPLTADMKPLHPIADSPAIPPAELPHWLNEATKEIKRTQQALQSI